MSHPRRRIPKLHLAFTTAVGSLTLLWGVACCVGDSASPVPDAGTTDGPVADVAIDAPVDAGPPAECDPKKPFGPPILVPELSSALDETGVRLSWDELTVYFNRPAGNGKNQIWYATRKDRGAAFAAPTQLANVGAASANVLHPMVSKDDKSLFFASDEGDAATTTSNLFLATRAIGGSPAVTPFTNAQRLVALAGPDVFSVTPYLSASGDELWFASAPTDAGGLHLRRAAAPAFNSSTLVAELDAPNDTTRFPVLSADGLTIYFDSNRAGGVGLVDIWFATRASTSAAFGAPKNATTLEATLNSAGVDSPTWISPDDCRLYITSTRDTLDAGATDRNVYLATRPK